MYLTTSEQTFKGKGKPLEKGLRRIKDRKVSIKNSNYHLNGSEVFFVES